MVLPLFIIFPISIFGVAAMFWNDDENVQRKILEAAAKEED